MIEKKSLIGHKAELEVGGLDAAGAWLGTGAERVLLPRPELKRPLAVGERLQVFVFRPEPGRLQARLQLPPAEVGEFAALKCRRLTREGGWFEFAPGLDLPVHATEIPFRLRTGERTLVRIGLDDQGMLCGSCRIADYLDPAQGLPSGRQVQLQVWRQTDLGTKMIIDGRYEGLLYADELPVARIGEKLVGFVTRLRADGKIDLSLNPGGKAGADIGRDRLLQALEESGFLPLHDNSSPEEIRRLLGLSKKQFKRAVGMLYKEKKIELLTKGIRLVDKSGE